MSAARGARDKYQVCGRVDGTEIEGSTRGPRGPKNWGWYPQNPQDSEEGYGLSSRTTTFLQNTCGPNFLFITVFVPGHSRGL